jgi:beta-lactamase class D
MQQTLNRIQVNIPSPQKKKKTKEKQEIQSTYEIANHMGSIQDPKLKDSKKPWKLDPMRGGGPS